ncbi:MAG: ABC transporter ATP-binding protein [Bacteroidota bacterium]
MKTLQISGLTVSYRNGVKALNELSLCIGHGVFGLLGPNGAGKSTFMRTVATLQLPKSGRILFNDIDVLATPLELRKVLGYLPQEFGVYPNISAEALLDYCALLKGMSKKEERIKAVSRVLGLTNLSDVRKKHADGFSGGMKQRFGIAQMLLADPQLIIVDEPTAGLDPSERSRFLGLLREIGQKHTVICSTHIVEDIAELSSSFAVLDHGRILLHTTPDDALRLLRGRVWSGEIETEDLMRYRTGYQLLSSTSSSVGRTSLRILADAEPSAHFRRTDVTLTDVYFAALSQPEQRSNK